MTEFGGCPQCDRRMRIEVMQCWHCGTRVTGRMSLPPLARLPRQHAEFVEQFLLANGSLSALQKVLDCSYPKVRRLLNETMAHLRAEVEAEIEEREQILQALEDNRIEGQEAVRLLRGLAGGA